MTRYSRSVIPGRSREDSDSLDRKVFGGRPEAANEDEAEAAGDEEESAPPRKRAGKKRGKSDFRMLPDEDGYRPQEEKGRNPILLIGALTVMIVFGAVVWNAYRDGVRAADAAAPPQLADAGPFKTRPETVEPVRTAGAEQASVFERVESGPKATPAEDVEPTPDVRAETPPPPPAAVVTLPPAPAAIRPPVTAAAIAPPPLNTPPPKPAAETPPPAMPTLAGGYAPAFSASGRFVVQVAAASTETAAAAEWDKRQKASPDLYGAAERFIVRADVNGKTVYRVRAGSFATAADADAFCAAIKGKGGDCFRTAK